jgi:hypothetical protein
MKAKTEYMDVRPDSNSDLRLAPSLRVPVTAGNRAFLRWLRAAEMSAWEAGRACSTQGNNFKHEATLSQF